MGCALKLKYPRVFTTSDVLIVSKTDYLAMPGLAADFDLETLRRRARELNPNLARATTHCVNDYGCSSCQFRTNYV